MYQGKYSAAAAGAKKRPAAPQEQPVPQPKPKKKQQKGIRIGTVIFYLLYFAAIAAFFIALKPIVMEPLEAWLTTYESSQPGVKSQEAFDRLFADPDWAEIYTLAGMGETEFENKEHYAQYMNEKMGSQKLTYSETSAGLSGDHKYIVKLGDEKVATFTLTGEDGGELDIPEWELGTVEIFFTRRQSASICTQPDHTVYINGKPLDDSFTVMTTYTAVEDYLPEGIHGSRTRMQYVTGLLVEPQITVLDAEGQPVTLIYDEEKDLYTEEFIARAEEQLPKDMEETVIKPVKTYCEYMIGASNLTEIKKYFDSSTQTYKSIRKSDTSWAQSFRNYQFSEPEFTDYVSYTEDLFSVKVTLTLKITRNNGTVKQFDLASHFFYQKQNGKWMVIEMTNVDITQQTTMVRLSFVQDDVLVDERMVSSTVSSLTLPEVTAAEGMVFSGWFLETVDENGDTTYTLAFAPDSNEVHLSEGTELEPMVLHALFEKEAA